MNSESFKVMMFDRHRGHWVCHDQTMLRTELVAELTVCTIETEQTKLTMQLI